MKRILGISMAALTLAGCGGTASVAPSSPATSRLASPSSAAYDSVDVPGVGDKAFIAKDGGMIGTARGNMTLLAHVVGFEKDAPPMLQAKQKAFIQTVLQHA